MKIIHQDCEKSLSKNKNLPLGSYIVSYISEDKEKNDIVQASSRVEIFDYYYDLYQNIVMIGWTNGNINSRNYNYTKPEKKKKS